MIIALIAISYVIESVTLGAFVFLSFGHNKKLTQSYRVFVLFTLILAVLNLLSVMAIQTLDMYIKFGDTLSAELLGNGQEYVRVNEIVSLDWSDPIFWLLQSFLAYYVGDRLYGFALRRALTSRSS